MAVASERADGPDHVTCRNKIAKVGTPHSHIPHPGQVAVPLYFVGDESEAEVAFPVLDPLHVVSFRLAYVGLSQAGSVTQGSASGCFTFSTFPGATFAWPIPIMFFTDPGMWRGGIL